MSQATTKAITPVGILSYPHIAKPQAMEEGKPAKYSATVIFSEGTDLSALQAAAVAAAEAAYPGKGKSMLKKGQLKSPFRTDCEAKDYKDCVAFINVRTEKQPGAVFSYADAETNKPKAIPLDQIEKELYPGAKVRVSVNAFAYNTSGNKGVSFALNNIQKVADGERIDGRAAAEDEFNSSDLSQAPVSDLPF
jgi:hypothetical protein